VRITPRDLIEAAVEYADRFPDQSDENVIEHVEFVYQIIIKENTVAYMIVLTAYNHGTAEAHAQYKRLTK